MRQKLILAATVVLLSLVLAACGGSANSSDDNETEDAGSPTTEEATTTTEKQTTTTAKATTTTGDEDEDEPADEGSEDDGDDEATTTTDEDEDDKPADDEDELAGDEDEDDKVEETTSADSLNGEELLLEDPPQRGDKNEAVVVLQEKLIETGFATGSADGDFGPKTEKSLVAFQRLAGLPHTGRVNKRTVEALYDFEYDGPILRAAGDNDEAEVIALQERLADGPFDPGPADGAYGTQTIQAIWALEKMAGIAVDGDWGPADEWALNKLEAGEIARPNHSHDLRWVEVDLDEQVARVYDPGTTSPVLVSHISSGNGRAWSNATASGSSNTPLGDYTISRRINGWRESSLNIGRLYNPLYFNGGIAFHGASSVPNYPASHGCIRVPMHIAEYLPEELPNGTPVHIYR